MTGSSLIRSEEEEFSEGGQITGRVCLREVIHKAQHAIRRWIWFEAEGHGGMTWKGIKLPGSLLLSAV